MNKLLYIIIIIILFACSEKQPLNNPNDPEYEITLNGGLSLIMLSDSKVKLEWERDENIVGLYKIERKISDGSFVVLINVSAETSTYIDSALTTDNIYYYRISGINDLNSSNFLLNHIQTNFISITNFEIEQNSIFQTTLTWEHNCSYEQGYIIERQEERLQSKFCKKNINLDRKNLIFIEIANLQSDTFEYIDENLVPNTTYEYRIKAFSNYNESDYACSMCETVIDSPTNLIYEILDSNSIELNWTDNSIGEDGFKIDKKVRGQDWQIEYDTVEENTEFWSDLSAEVLNGVYYRLYAYSNSSNSSSITIYSSITFVKSFDSNSEFVQQTFDGSYIFCGDNDSSQLLLSKADFDGSDLWSQTFYGVGSHSVKQTMDDGFIMIGYTDEYNNEDVLLIKTDSFGNEEWLQIYETYNDFEAYSVSQTNDNGFIFCGYKLNSWDNEDIYLCKTNSDGDIVWSNTFDYFSGTSVYERGKSVFQTSDSGYIIACSVGSWGDCGRLIKTDHLGNVVWNIYDNQKTFTKVSKTFDDGYIIAAQGPANSTAQDYGSIIKIDINGNIEWSQIIRDNENDYDYKCKSVKQTFDGGYIVFGGIDLPYAYNLWLIKLDSNGTEVWKKIYLSYDSIGNSLQQTIDGGFVFGGDNYIIKTDYEGNVNERTSNF